MTYLSEASISVSWDGETRSTLFKSTTSALATCLITPQVLSEWSRMNWESSSYLCASLYDPSGRGSRSCCEGSRLALRRRCIVNYAHLLYAGSIHDSNHSVENNICWKSISPSTWHPEGAARRTEAERGFVPKGLDDWPRVGEPRSFENNLVEPSSLLHERLDSENSRVADGAAQAAVLHLEPLFNEGIVRRNGYGFRYISRDMSH